MGRRHVARIFPALVGFMAFLAAGEAMRTAILFHARSLHISRMIAYHILFSSEWVSQLVEICLLVMIIYGLFSETMRPFPGLKRIGRIVFRWVGSVSLLVAVAISLTPELFAKGATFLAVYTEVNGRFQQGIYVLILCLLIFVCFAIRPLGLTFRSHIFGVVLGLGVYSTVQLIQAAWLATAQGADLYSSVYVFEAAGDCVAVGVWLTYFALPEPKRRMILLPTTSPFFLWNRISEVLGDAPGSVVVAGFTPDMLAAAEIEMLTMAISREEASAQEREDLLSGGAVLDDTVELPSPTESQLALSL